MQKLFTLIVAFLLTTTGFSQDPDYLDLLNVENRLKELFGELYSDEQKDRERILKEIEFLMPEALSLEGAMEYPWEKLVEIGVRTSDDGKLRLFTWHLADGPDSYRYFGYIQLAQRKKRVKVFPLVDNHESQESLFNLDQSTSDWYGKLYYGIVTNSAKRKTYYTLLGMDFNNTHSNIKTVEIIRIQRNEPRFVQKMFYNERERVDRVVLEYSDQVSMSVRQDPNLEMIVFDHLVPFNPIYQGQFQFYGPDGSFDGLEFTGEGWLLKEDVDARMDY